MYLLGPFCLHENHLLSLLFAETTSTLDERTEYTLRVVLERDIQVMQGQQSNETQERLDTDPLFISPQLLPSHLL